MCLAGDGPDSVGQNASVCLLDWYVIDQEVILVMERPTPSENLYEYCLKNAPLPDAQAKEITRQVVEGLNILHAKKVFHRDIKMENILIQSTPFGPRVRIIDFGCGSKVHARPYHHFEGKYSSKYM